MFQAPRSMAGVRTQQFFATSRACLTNKACSGSRPKEITCHLGSRSRHWRAISRFPGNTATNRAAAARPPRRRVRGHASRAAVVSSAAPDPYVQLRGSPGISGGMMLSKGSGLREVQGSRSSTQRRQETSGAMSVCGLVRGFVCALAEHSSRLRQRPRCRHPPRQYPSAGVLVHELDLDVGVNTFRNAAVELLVAVVDELEWGHRHLGGDGALARDLDSFAVDTKVSVMVMLNECGLRGAPSLRATEGLAWSFCRRPCVRMPSRRTSPLSSMDFTTRRSVSFLEVPTRSPSLGQF